MPTEKPTFKSCRILIVDDEPAILHSLRQALSADGHVIQAMDDSRAALSLFEKDKFDLVILDYEMPDVKGDELALIIKALVPDQAIAMITAFPDKLRSNLLIDVDVVIGKPFKPQELRDAVNRFCTRLER